MLIDDINVDELKYALKHMLDAKRYAHTLAVCDAAVTLAERFGADKNKAYLAALLHDCARGLDDEQQVAYCDEHGIELDDFMKRDVNPVHALTGADMANRRFGIVDESILTAIKNHAVGSAHMTLLDKILFVADGIEVNRTGRDADEARAAAKCVLDDAIIPVMRIKSYYLNSKPMHPNSVMMLDNLTK